MRFFEIKYLMISWKNWFFDLKIVYVKSFSGTLAHYPDLITLGKKICSHYKLF